MLAGVNEITKDCLKYLLFTNIKSYIIVQTCPPESTHFNVYNNLKCLLHKIYNEKHFEILQLLNILTVFLNTSVFLKMEE